MKVEIPQKNQIKITITFVVVAVLVALLILLGEKAFIVKEKISDSAKFYTEYNSVPVDNVFKYVTIDEAINLLKSEQAIIFFGFKECKWCQSYAPILNEVAHDAKIDTIYYLNIKEDRANNTKEYNEVVEVLKDYLYDDEKGNKRIYVPDVYFIKNGQVIGHNNDTSVIEGTDTDEYYTESTKNELKQALKELMLKVYDESETCDDSKKGC